MDLFRSKTSSDNTSTPSNVTEPPPEKDFYSTDLPISDAAFDEFKRLPFARRIAHTIAARRDASSLVIGIYGAWGEGKTTVLRFIEQEFKVSEFEHIIPVWFNPWRFNSEALLLQSFFKTLADALGKSLSKLTEDLGRVLDTYGGALVPPIKFGEVEISPGSSFSAFGKALSTVELEDLKKRIENLLEKEGKRVVVLMDDIDRLDKEEIQTVFKLVKLSADFAYTAYILSFDDEMVAAALQEKYASGKHSGQSFLEKIIQVPLQLPKVDPLSLRIYCFRGIQEALREAQIELSREQSRTFLQQYIDGLEPRIQTPRMCKRYSNALSFALTILKDEVHPIDLMLIEGIRICYPRLYDIIRINPDIFIGPLIKGFGNDEQLRESAPAIIAGTLEGYTTIEKEAANKLLQHLFPNLGTKRRLNSDQMNAEQRIASRDYFYRYFAYTVPPGDVPDQELNAMLVKAESESVANLLSDIRKLIGDRSADRFVWKLRAQSEGLSASAARNLAPALARFGGSYPMPEGEFAILTAFTQGSIVIRELLQNIPAAEGRFDIAKQVVSEAEPILFAIECFDRMRPSEDDEERQALFSPDELMELGKLVATRIKDIASERILYTPPSRDAAYLLSFWSQLGSRNETQEYLSKTFVDDPHNAVEFIKCYLPSGWPFRGDTYRSITSVVDGDIIYDTLSKAVPTALESPGSRNAQSIDERAVQQFVSIYSVSKSQAQVQSVQPEQAGIDSEID